MFKRFLSIIIMLGLIFVALAGCSKFTSAKAIEEKLALANKYVMEQKYEEAILTFQEIIKIDPKLIKPYVGIAHVYLLEGKPEQAEKTLHDALRVVDDKNGIQMGLGNIYVEEQKYNEAEKTFLAIIDQDNKYQDAYEGLVQVYQAQSQVDKVLDILNQAIRNNPDNPKNYSLIAIAYVQKGDRAKALDMVKTSLNINADENYEAFDALGNIFGQDWGSLIAEGEKLLAVDSKDKTGAIFKFYGLFNTGEYQKALDFYQTAQDNLVNGRIKVDVALSYYRMGDKDKAQGVINTIDLDKIKNESFLINLINYFNETGNKDKAIELAKKGLLFERKLADFYLLLYQLTGDKQYLAWLHTIGSSLDKVYYALGLEAEKQKEWDRAIDYFSKAISLNSAVPEYFFERGKSYLFTTQNHGGSAGLDIAQKGLEDCLIALNKGLTGAECYFYIADAYNNFYGWKLRAEEGAQRALPFIDKACSLMPENSSYLASYSYYLLNAGRFEEALAKAELALKKAQTNNDKMFAYEHCGWSYNLLKRYDEAIDSYKRALEFTEDNEMKAQIYMELGESYKSLGQNDLARESLMKIKEFTKLQSMMKNADRLLQELQ